LAGREILTDSYGRVHDYLRLSVTDRCDLGCFYCRPAGGFRPKGASEILNDCEILRLAGIFSRLGVRKIRLTGGEPLLRPNLSRLIKTLREVDGIETLGLTTNGTHLAENAGELRGSGLDLVNISLDTLRPERFRRINGGTVHGRVLEGVRAAVEAGFKAVKLNMVVVRGVNDDEALDFAALACRLPITVRFIEYMPFTDNPWKRDGFISSRETRERIERHFDIQPIEPGNESGSVSRDWSIGGGVGRIGFISALSGHFCGHCSRLRLTADGMLKLCLFSPAVADLRSPLRESATDDDIRGIILGAMRLKPSAHPSAEALAEMKDRVMTQVGG